jgi:hypothetical protein
MSTNNTLSQNNAVKAPLISSLWEWIRPKDDYDSRFHCGFYTYADAGYWVEYAQQDPENLGWPPRDEKTAREAALEYWIKRLVDEGEFNVFYVGVNREKVEDEWNYRLMEFFLKLSRDYNFKMIVQLDFATLRFKASFKLTEQSFETLSDKEIPEDVLENLQPLENEEFEDEETFVEAVKEKIGEEQTAIYEELILKHAKIEKPRVSIEYLAEQAIPFIKTYKDEPNVLAFSVAEEPSLERKPYIEGYYELIRKSVPDAEFYLLFKTDKEELPEEDFCDPAPIIKAVEPYTFHWDFSGGYCLARPKAALKWYRRSLKRVGEPIRRNGIHFSVVFTTYSREIVWPQQKVWGNLPPDDPDDPGDEHDEIKNSIIAYADDEEEGWLWVDKDDLKYFKYYHPPQNCTRAMVWLAVMMGAKSIFQFLLKPTRLIYQEIIKERLYDERGADVNAYPPLNFNEKTGVNWEVHILGLDNKGTHMLTEYAETCKDLQDFGWLINRMKYDDDHNQDPNTKLLMISEEGKTFSTSFSLETDRYRYSGKIVVLVNRQVGTVNESFRISSDVKKHGEVFAEDFQPDTEPRSIQISLTPPILFDREYSLWDLKSGRCLTSTPGEKVTIEVQPGGGNFFFIGEYQEMSAIRRFCGLEQKGCAAMLRSLLNVLNI